MKNEILLVVSMVALYGAVLLWYKLFGRSGMYCFTVFATIAANIEVLLLVDAFGMEMTLGTILFAALFHMERRGLPKARSQHRCRVRWGARGPQW